MASTDAGEILVVSICKPRDQKRVSQQKSCIQLELPKRATVFKTGQSFQLWKRGEGHSIKYSGYREPDALNQIVTETMMGLINNEAVEKCIKMADFHHKHF